jgi:uncharacterized membrane protein YcaP (DUF421 family)
MNAVLRPLFIYVCLLIIFRITGKRALGEITNFDFVVLLIVSECVSSGLLAQDYSLTGAVLAVSTLLFLDLTLSLLKQRFRRLARILEDEPVHIMERGKLFTDRMNKERVDEDDILEAARSSHGIENMRDIDSAVLERHGTISIIPVERPGR